MTGPTYEVYIDVRHHPRHLDDWEKREGWAAKLVQDPAVDLCRPTREEYLPMVIRTLRAFADELEREL